MSMFVRDVHAAFTHRHPTSSLPCHRSSTAQYRTPPAAVSSPRRFFVTTVVVRSRSCTPDGRRRRHGSLATLRPVPVAPVCCIYRAQRCAAQLRPARRSLRRCTDAIYLTIRCPTDPDLQYLLIILRHFRDRKYREENAAVGLLFYQFVGQSDISLEETSLVYAA